MRLRQEPLIRPNDLTSTWESTLEIQKSRLWQRTSKSEIPSHCQSASNPIVSRTLLIIKQWIISSVYLDTRYPCIVRFHAIFAFVCQRTYIIKWTLPKYESGQVKFHWKKLSKKIKYGIDCQTRQVQQRLKLRGNAIFLPLASDRRFRFDSSCIHRVCFRALCGAILSFFSNTSLGVYLYVHSSFLLTADAPTTIR